MGCICKAGFLDQSTPIIGPIKKRISAFAGYTVGYSPESGAYICPLLGAFFLKICLEIGACMHTYVHFFYFFGVKNIIVNLIFLKYLNFINNGLWAVLRPFLGFHFFNFLELKSHFLINFFWFLCTTQKYASKSDFYADFLPQHRT